jgi:hypothetical protein
MSPEAIKACIHLGIPDTGFAEIDEIIRKGRRQRLASEALNGLLSREHGGNITMRSFAAISTEAADYLIQKLDEVPKEPEIVPKSGTITVPPPGDNTTAAPGTNTSTTNASPK